MKTYQRLFIFGLAAVGFAALLSPWAALSWHWFSAGGSGAQSDPYPFSRIFDRCFMISGIVLYFIFRKSLKFGSLNELGLTPRSHAGRDIVVGSVTALISIVILGILMSWIGVYKPFLRHPWPVILARCGSALLAAIGAGFIEEIFFRGIIFKGLREDLGEVRGYLFACLFFSAIHFVQPANDAPLTTVAPLAGFVHLFKSFGPFLDLGRLFPGLFGLFLIGAILCYAFERTGTLYLSMGLHGGWIVGIKTIGTFGLFRREDLGWMFGSSDPKIVSGVFTWIGMMLVAVAVHQITKRRARLFARHTTSVFSPPSGLGNKQI
jgi:membrane protease YdiL (CAAX protease family)